LIHPPSKRRETDNKIAARNHGARAPNVSQLPGAVGFESRVIMRAVRPALL
jgi:hypothetical protein